MSRPWDDEPNGAEFESSGYPCVIRRGPMGHLCGYVGIPLSHPWYNKGYDELVEVPGEVLNRPLDNTKVDVIGLFLAKKEDTKAGKIEIDLAVDVHGGLTFSSCAPPEHEGGGLWWFGFDCAHAGDLSPSLLSPRFSRPSDVYRDINYVKRECASLAEQLHKAEEKEDESKSD